MTDPLVPVRDRVTFSKLREALPLPDLVAIQPDEGRDPPAGRPIDTTKPDLALAHDARWHEVGERAS